MVTGWAADYLAQYGIAIEMIPASSEKTDALLASGELPDLVRLGEENMKTAIEGGMILELDQYEDKLNYVTTNAMPNVRYMRELLGGEEQRWYCMPTYIGDWDKTGEPDQYALRVRWDLYQKIGAPKIEKLEDLVDMCKKMMELEPVTADGTPTSAININTTKDSVYMRAVNVMMGATGYYTGVAREFVNINLKENKVTSILANPEDRTDPTTWNNQFLRTLHLYFLFNQAGLLDPNVLTMDETEMSSKLTSGAYMLNAYYLPSGIGFNTEENKNADEPKGYMPLVFDEMYPILSASYHLSKNEMIAISSAIDSQKLEAALAFINLCFDHEAYFTLNMGPQNETWYVDENGTAQLTEGYLSALLNNEDFVMSSGEVFKPANTELGGSLSYNRYQKSPLYNAYAVASYYPEIVAATNDSKLFQAWNEYYKHHVSSGLYL